MMLWVFVIIVVGAVVVVMMVILLLLLLMMILIMEWLSKIVIIAGQVRWRRWQSGMLHINMIVIAFLLMGFGLLLLALLLLLLRRVITTNIGVAIIAGRQRWQ